jgi:ABC-type enterochelin transport system substrate-binding protein
MIKSTFIYASLFFSSAEASHPTIRGAKDDNKESRSLFTAATKVTGECTVDNFLTAVQNNQATLAQILGVENDIPTIEKALEESCASAREGTL